MRRSFDLFYRSNITTISTWDRHLPPILEAIRKCEFVSVDLELSGLYLRNERFVGVEQSYQSHCECVRSFQPVQLGICAARRSDPTGQNWILTPASIYIYPRQDKIFQVSSSTLMFLKQNSFDFNEWIGSGIDYLSPIEEEERKATLLSRINLAKKELESKSQDHSVNTTSSLLSKDVFDHISLEDAKYLHEIKSQIAEWIKTSSPILEIDAENGFRRLLIHSMIPLEYNGIYSTTIKRENHRFISIFRSYKYLIEQQIRGLENELQELNNSAGVRKILEEISKFDKILIGHNCFYDFLHLNQIINGSLPPELSIFKENWIRKFPINFDTKYISETHELLASLQLPSTLKGLCDHLSSSENFSKNISFTVECIGDTNWKNPRHSENGSHEAGFDSMMTSMVFILQCSYILKSKNLSWQRFEICPRPNALSILDLLPLMVNRIRLARTQPNVIHLTGNEEADMNRHFFITGLTPYFTKSDVLKLISPLWGNIIIDNEGSCWLIVKNEEDARSLLNMYNSAPTNFPFKLYTFHEFQEMKNSLSSHN